MTSKIHLAICMPTMGPVDPGTAIDFGVLCLYLGNNAERLGISAVTVHQKHLTYLPVAREELAMQALGQGSTHLLWIDSDMRFDFDAVERLLGHDLPIVGANYRRRGVGSLSTAARIPDSAPVVARETGLEQVGHMGMGLCLIKAEVFSKVPRPWFEAGYREGRFLGEDFVFFTKARGEGYPIVVDHDISKGVGHMWAQEHRLDIVPLEPDGGKPEHIVEVPPQRIVDREDE